MSNKKICITTDCVCDLPEDILKRNNVDLIYFYIETDTGRFRDVSEITAQNIFEYIENGGKKTITTAPSEEQYYELFEKKLKSFDEVIHIAISDGISLSVKHSKAAVERLGEKGERVHIFDSGHLSTGIAHFVLRAAKMARRGCGTEEILDEMAKMKPKVSSSFMADKAEYLFRNNKVSNNVRVLCDMFNIHPVLCMRDGKLVLKSVQIGDYRKCAVRYVRNVLKRSDKIKKDTLFITHAGCTVNDLRLIKKEVSRIAKFDSIVVTKASATISGNSGPRTFGLLYIEE